MLWISLSKVREAFLALTYALTYTLSEIVWNAVDRGYSYHFLWHPRELYNVQFRTAKNWCRTAIYKRFGCPPRLAAFLYSTAAHWLLRAFPVLQTNPLHFISIMFLYHLFNVYLSRCVLFSFSSIHVLYLLFVYELFDSILVSTLVFYRPV